MLFSTEPGNTPAPAVRRLVNFGPIGDPGAENLRGRARRRSRGKVARQPAVIAAVTTSAPIQLAPMTVIPAPSTNRFRSVRAFTDSPETQLFPLRRPAGRATPRGYHQSVVSSHLAVERQVQSLQNARVTAS